MSLKRKRSSIALSSPMSDTSTSTTSPDKMQFFYNQSKPIPSPCPSFFADAQKHHYDNDSPSHLNSRTRKRYRDNRPNEEQIHANTMTLLYSAARQHPVVVSPEPSPSSVAAIHRQPPRPQGSTLHSFWRLPPSDLDLTTAKIQISTDQQNPGQVSTCEDCDREIRGEDAMDVDFRIGEGFGDVGGGARCGACGRVVCDLCAVRERERRCLECAE